MRSLVFSALSIYFFLGTAWAQGVSIKPFDSWSYRAIGPANMGGRTTDVEGVPGNPAIVYVGTGGGGLWKTTNGGTTWTALWEREGSYSVGDLALDPKNPDVVWLGSGEANMRNSVSFGDGIYRSTDGGKTWMNLGLKETEHIARVMVNPLDSNMVWVCAVGHQGGPNEERGVFVTTDNGATWKKTLYVDDKHGCSDLDIDPTNPNIVYASMWRFERKPWNHTSGSELSGLFRSTDGGMTWKKSTQGLPKLLGRTGVKVAPSNPNVVYAATESKEGTLYRSTNAGESWQQMTNKREVVGRGFYYADLRVDPKDENRVYAIATALQVSIDGGRTFREISGQTHSDFHALWIDPTNTSRMWQGQDGGIAVSYDRGATWQAVQNIPLGQYYQIHADNRAPFYNITGGLQDNGTYTGPSGVRQRAGILNSDWQLVSFGDGFYAWSSPENPDLFLTESQGGSIIRSDFASGEQQGVSPQPRSGRIADLKYRFNWNTPFVASPHGKSSIFFGSNVLFQSRDTGKSWEPISPDLTTNNRERMVSAGGPVWFDNSTAENYGTIITVGESPVKAGIVWVGTDDGNVQVTKDGGKSWANVARALPGIPQDSVISHVEPSRTGADAAYVAVERHLFDDYKPYIFKTTDGGRSWTSLTSGLPEKAYVQIVREDPKNPQLLYAGTELGLFVSFNGGGAWQPMLLKNLAKVAVHDILIHPRENDLILATHGRSLMVLDDITALQQMSEQIAQKPAHLFEARAAWRHATPMRSYGLGSEPYIGPNPPYGAILSYFLKDKADEKATVEIEVLDGSGKVIRTVKRLSKEAGVNRASWDLRYDGPTVRTPPTENETRFGGGARGPQAVPGVYTVRLKAAGQISETKVEVKADPALKSTQQELAAQLTMALQVRDLVSSVNTTLRKMDGLKKQLTDMEALGKQQAPEKMKEWGPVLAEYKKELDKVSETIAIRTGGSRLEDAPMLAEDLSGLYGGVANNNSAPTAPQVAYWGELQKRATTEMAAANALLVKAAKEWNEKLRQMGAPGLVIGTGGPEESGGRP